jgi:predicted O-methyltransferase YrrM
VLDERVREVLGRLEQEDRAEREQGLPMLQRSRAVAPTTGAFLYALVAGQPSCEVLEIGGSRGYSTVWLGAGARLLGGHVTSLEADPVKLERSAATIADA